MSDAPRSAPRVAEEVDLSGRQLGNYRAAGNTHRSGCLLSLARELASPEAYAIAIINTDAQVALKGSRVFMNEIDRRDIVGAIRYVNEAILSIDKDGSQCATLRAIRTRFPYESIIFAKGGDRNWGNIPEADVCRELNIKIVDGLGAKIRASSDILRNAVA